MVLGRPYPQHSTTARPGARVQAGSEGLNKPTPPVKSEVGCWYPRKAAPVVYHHASLGMTDQGLNARGPRQAAPWCTSELGQRLECRGLLWAGDS